MKKVVIIIAFCLIIILGIGFYAPKPKDSSLPEEESTPEETIEPESHSTDSIIKGKKLVVYFSMPDEMDNSYVVIHDEKLGNTQYVASIITQHTDADLFRIEAATPYPTNHQALTTQAQEEFDKKARPAIKDTIPDFETYETVYVCYPIWWGDMPMILYTFFETYDFAGKTIIAFSTHGGSGFSGTPAKIAELEPMATVIQGRSISRDLIYGAEQIILNFLSQDLSSELQ